MYRMMVADYDSPSYFVATAAVKLGFFKKEGVDVEFVAEYGAKHGPERLRDGTIHFFGDINLCHTFVKIKHDFLAVGAHDRKARQK